MREKAKAAREKRKLSRRWRRESIHRFQRVNYGKCRGSFGRHYLPDGWSDPALSPKEMKEKAAKNVEALPKMRT